jgi:transketolase
LSTTDPKALEQLCINTIRILSADAVQNANSGHPGMPMGAAAMAYTLWMKQMKFNPKNPAWADRDRFLLSAGHGSMLLYSLLHLTGYDLSLDEIKRFRQWESQTPGHPERGHTRGVEVATGPLGQGFSNAVGMAMAEAWLGATFNKPDHKIMDHYTFGICGDGDLMEGITNEAASIAGHLQLGKLIFLYDRNHITLAGGTDLCFTEDVGGRFDALGWQTIHVEDGNDTAAVEAAIVKAKAETKKPTLILVRTHIGYGSPKKHDNFSAHGSPLGEEELLATKKFLSWPSEEKFYLPPDAVAHFREAVDKGAKAQAEWEAKLNAYKAAYPKEAAEFEQFTSGKIPDDFAVDIPKWKVGDKAIATRVAGGEVLNALAKHIRNIVGGSADLNPSTNTAMKGMGDFQPPVTGLADMGAVGGPWGYEGRNTAFGVREHAMAAAVNGMAAHGGILPFGSSFLVFTDYAKPSIRLSALSKLKVFWIFTHDSIGVGEDGPTHEPVEQLAGLRAIPFLNVMRPGDPTEVAESYVYAAKHEGPTLFALSRQNVPHLDRSRAKNPGAAKGAYILSEADGDKPAVILIGSGSEVSLCVAAQKKLKEAYGISARVVSMPSMNLFEEQDAAYRDSVLPKSIRARVTIEAGTTFGWDRWAGSDGAMIGLERFGASAPGEEVMQRLGFRAESVTAAALRLLGRHDEAAKEASTPLEIDKAAPMHHA